MKKVKILLIACFSSIMLFSQSIDKLDERNGYKDFKLGDDLTKWINQIQYINNINDVKVYRYLGTCCETIFSLEIDGIYLNFSNNKLSGIIILIKPYQDFRNKSGIMKFEYPFVKHDALVQNFSELFGKPQTKKRPPTPKGGNLQSDQWIGKKVVLNIHYYYDDPNRIEYSEIHVIDKATALKNIEEEF